jgi:hypothetical protein
MANFNHKGPENQGSQTGRKLGKCNPDNKGLTEEEIINKNANQPQQGARRQANNISSSEMENDTRPRNGIGRGRGLGKSSGKGRGIGKGNR